MKKDFPIYWKLFSSTFYLSSFTFGGGFVIIPLMKKKFVDDLKWIEEKEMLNITAIAQSSPGAVAVNTSILLGYRIAGFPGSFITILGTIGPPIIILSIISVFYNTFKDNALIHALLNGMQAGVAAVIVNVVIDMIGKLMKRRDILSVPLMLGAFIATFLFKVNVLYIIVICGTAGFLYAYAKSKMERSEKN